MKYGNKVSLYEMEHGLFLIKLKQAYMTILISFSIGFVVGMLSAYLHELYLADKHDREVAEMYEDDDEIFIE